MLYGSTISVKEYGLLKGTPFNYAELSCKELMSLSKKEFNYLIDNVNRGLPVLALNAYCSSDLIIAGPGYEPYESKVYAVKAARLANELGVEKVVIGSPLSRTLPNGFDRSIASKQLQEFLLFTAEEFARYNITVCLEPLSKVFCNFVNTVEEAVHFVDILAHPYIKLVIDFYNMEHEGEADFDLQQIRDFIHHVHISDDEDSNHWKRSYLKEEKKDVHQSRLKRIQQLKLSKTISLEVDVSMNKDKAIKSYEIMSSSNSE